jgi:hypothetical protein
MMKTRRESARSSRRTLSHFRESWELRISRSLPLAGRSSIFANFIRQWCLAEGQIEFPTISYGKK